MEELSKANTQVKIDYAEQLKDETEKFQRSMDFLKNQILVLIYHNTKLGN